jgi:hypothetical protein
MFARVSAENDSNLADALIGSRFNRGALEAV